MKIEFIKPNIGRGDINKMVRSVESGWLVPGEYTEWFEEELSHYLGSPAVMVSSCTAALHLALIMAGVKEGDEVITTPISWVATANVILYLKAIPVFVDVEEKTGLIDIDKIREKITAKTKAIIPVHLYGQMVDMKKLRALADEYDLKIIEDSAHALEAQLDGVYPGQLGDYACFSFHAAKNITAGGGGALVSRHPERVKLLRRHGVSNIDGKRVMIELGFKYEPADYQAALLIGQLNNIEQSHLKRKEVCDRYRRAFRGKVMFPDSNGINACHMFVIWVENRDKIRVNLAKKGIETSIHYPAIHLEPYYQKIGFRKGSFPIAEKLGASTITLPTYALTKEQQDYIIAEVLNESRPDSAR